MKYIGLDLGSRTCGIAISDALGMIARCYDTLRFDDDDYEYAANKIIEICKAEGVKNIVLGLPKHMNGDLGVRAQISEDFKKNIESKSDIKVELVDERLTTIIVDKTMISGNVKREKRKEKKDELAAVVILQNYLDRKF
ncbi:MAG: Holliday junction resolvase RuvX [Anaeroplasmataceae bacterium]